MELRIFRKGGKESIVYFSDEVRDVLETYLDERQAIERAFQVMRTLCSCPCRKKG